MGFTQIFHIMFPNMILTNFDSASVNACLSSIKRQSNKRESSSKFQVWRSCLPSHHTISFQRVSKIHLLKYISDSANVKSSKDGHYINDDLSNLTSALIPAIWNHSWDSHICIVNVLQWLCFRQRPGGRWSLHAQRGGDSAQQLPAEARARGRGQGRVRGQDAAQHRPPPRPPHHRQGVQGMEISWQGFMHFIHVELFYNCEAASFVFLYGRKHTKTKILSITGTCIAQIKNIFCPSIWVKWMQCT